MAIAARAVAGLVTVAVLAASGWGWYLGRVADASVNRTDAIPTEGNEGIGGGAAMNLLLVGNDSRAQRHRGAARRAQHHGDTTASTPTR